MEKSLQLNAYGALTINEAIVCAYLRGRATKQKTETAGTMVAIGLSSVDVEPYLVDGVVIACENSPSSTTLSGDEDKIITVFQLIKNNHQDVFARRLQVNITYHSLKLPPTHILGYVH